MGILFVLELMVIGFLVYGIYRQSKNGICKSKKRLDGMTCLVTGGTSGIGLEISIDFALRGARVIVACPFKEEGTNAEKKIIEESGNSNVVFKYLDLACFGSVRNFAADILNTEDRLDILMNNAGVAAPIKELEDGLSSAMKVNYLGHFLLTLLLLPLLKKTGTPSAPSRIVNTSSVMNSWAKMDVKNFFAQKKTIVANFRTYANSKLCLVLFSRKMKKLIGLKVVINNVDPGEVFTNIFISDGYFYGYVLAFMMWCIGKTPYEGAQTPLHVALDEKAGEVSGLFYRDCRVHKPSKAAFDEDLIKEVWDKSVKLVQLGDEELKHLLA